MTARSLRNNNPGNLRKSDDAWQGLCEDQTDPDFFQFVDMVHGVRAMAITLLGYQINHGIKTIQGIINRYAPSNENDTAAYIKRVCNFSGIGETDPVDLKTRKDLKPIMIGMMMVESGVQSPVSDDDINKGLSLAGIA